jgi:hypothetical protein
MGYPCNEDLRYIAENKKPIENENVPVNLELLYEKHIYCHLLLVFFLSIRTNSQLH